MLEATGTPPKKPKNATGVVLLEDGSVFWGKGFGSKDTKVGEVVFNTSCTGYQEIISDPSYAQQIITFTFPHIGNVGVNPEDMESRIPASLGCILRMDITQPANWRARDHMEKWLLDNNLVGISGLDTRQITTQIRNNGAPRGVIKYSPDGKFDLDELFLMLQNWPGIKGMDLAESVTCDKPYKWSEGLWDLRTGFNTVNNIKSRPKPHVVAIDFGIKKNILRCLFNAGCEITVVPATFAANAIFDLNPDGIFLSNGPGDPAATAKYALPTIKEILKYDKPIFGICLGHQLLALALGATTYKLQFGHRGSNQPVEEIKNKTVEITSQNHGFAVDRGSLPDNVIETHRSLFDGIVEGIEVAGKPIFSVQYHPEASPGPQDSNHLFSKFINLMNPSFTTTDKDSNENA
ncbi:MAG: carbamoyl phosphate synthase small subunit [Rhodospirillaceae bacterium]|nr:carbamoyl phosphate synthase small subunit [Rhodospirillaceae bacterium]